MTYQRGTSGNPKGRPKGRGNKELSLLKGAVSTEDSLTILDKIVDAAKAGDPLMIKLYVNKMCPPLVPKDRTVKLTGLTKKQSLSEKAHSVLNAVATGLISPSEAEHLTACIGNLGKIIDAEQMIKDLEELKHRVDELQSQC